MMPSLHATKQNLMELMSNNSPVKFCKPLVECILNGIDTRFNDVLNFESEEGQIAVIAACSHPFFKLKWISDPAQIGNVKDKLLHAAREIQENATASKSNYRGATSATRKELIVLMTFK